MCVYEATQAAVFNPLDAIGLSSSRERENIETLNTVTLRGQISPLFLQSSGTCRINEDMLLVMGWWMLFLPASMVIGGCRFLQSVRRNIPNASSYI